MNILVCATGSIAAIKTPILCDELRKSGHIAPLVVTESAKFFIDQHYKSEAPRSYRDCDEWKDSYKIGDSVLHIELRSWADVLVIAPCSANSLAKISYGLADNLVTCIARAWDFNKLCVLAPAMNTMMWDNPVTLEQLERVSRRGFCIIDPITKKLACGEIGMGAMAEVKTIVDYIIRMC